MSRARKGSSTEITLTRAEILATRDSRTFSSALLQCDYRYLTYLVYGIPKELRYTVFEVPKRNGGVRKIMAPHHALRVLQQRLALVLDELYQPRPAAHGFVRGRGIVTNARYHCKRRFVFNLDLQDFFPSINYGRVRGLFKAAPYSFPDDVATLLAHICCFENQLPQGAPTSPVVSNMICRSLDFALQELAKKHNCRFTRYADDISFSTNCRVLHEDICVCPEDSPLLVGEELSRIIQSSGFSVNPKKVWIRRWDQRQEVTGLTVNRKPNVPRRLIRQVRAMLHAWAVYGEEKAGVEHVSRYRKFKHSTARDLPPSFSSVVRGKIAYLMMVRGKDDAVTKCFWRRYNTLKTSRRHFRTPRDQVRAALWVIEVLCTDKNGGVEVFQGTGFELLDIGVVTCAHVFGDAQSLCGEIRARRAEEPWRDFDATIVHINFDLDVAVVKIGLGSEDLPSLALEMDPSDPLEDHKPVTIAGFPSYRLGDTASVSDAKIIAQRKVHGVQLSLVNTPIVKGGSGGPVLNVEGYVVGIAATGADRIDDAGETEHHGVIPITVLRHVLPQIS